MIASGVEVISEQISSGVAVLKPEFVIKGPELVKPEGYAEIEKPVGCDGVNKECEEQPSKRARTYEKKKKEKGQNKNRGPTYRQNRESLLCPQIFEGNECPLEKCIYVHDIKKFLEDKPPDIDSVCPVFSVRGLCPRGVTCRYGSQHIDKEGNSIVDQSLLDEWEANKQTQTINSLSKSVQVDLRKRKYDFARSEEALLRLDKRKPKTKPESEKEANASENDSELSQTKDVAENCIGPADTEFPRSVREKKRSIDWKDKLYLSPLTTVGNLPFRRICKEFGVDITCGEMAMASNILQGANQEWALIKRHGTEDIFGVQVCGNNPYVLTRCAQVLQEQADIDFVDINMGCPIDLVYQQGGGCGLMRREKVLYSVVECMNDVLDIPLTIKMRTGIYSDKSTAHKLISGLCARGVSLITVHGRSREQRYTRSADWSYIETCAKLAGETPLFGNGDILSYEDYVEARKNCPSISGVMIGRGALIKPWIFTEIKEQRMWDISSNERFEIIKKYVNYGLHHWGSDTKGVENTRRFLLEWLSFLYRYIPVGLLETPPQKVNQRPPFYRGRNDLETLMASPNCDDWVKISEMLLGPVPDGFTFLPKHKANSWK